MKKKKILICGAGSIGVFIGTMLHSDNHYIKLFGRRKLRKVEEEIIINNKKFKVPEKLFKIPKDGRYDFIFITTKLYDFDYMVKMIKKSKARSSIIASVQNGLVDTSKYSKFLKKKIVPMTVFSGFNLLKDRIEVNPTSVGWKTEYSKQGMKISKLLSYAGIPCNPDKNFDSLRAEKTIVNCCLNALSAIENKTFYELFKNKKTSKKILRLFYECYNILKKEYKLGDTEEMKKRMFKNWSRLRHYSSTCQDIHSGRRNEVNFFNGYIVKLGKKYNLPTKNNEIILKETIRVARKNKFLNKKKSTPFMAWY